MFESGKYYLCIETRNVNSTSINDFIDTVFGNNKRIREYRRGGRFNSYDEYYDDYNDSLGVFSKNRIYHCPTNNALVDDKDNLIFLSDYNGYTFEEVEFDISDVNDMLSKFYVHKNGLITLEPYAKIGDEIMYRCKITIFGKMNKGVAVAMSSDKAYAITLAYKEARKNLLTKTRLFNSICGLTINDYGIH